MSRSEAEKIQSVNCQNIILVFDLYLFFGKLHERYCFLNPVEIAKKYIRIKKNILGQSLASIISQIPANF